MNATPINYSCQAEVCSHKLAFILDNWIRKLFQNPKKIVGEYIHEGDTVIDLGCGPGFFSIVMASMVGEKGKVIAADLQEEMLAHVRKKAAAKHLTKRMEFHRCQSDKVGLTPTSKANFILAFYMVHETPNPAAFLTEVRSLLKEDGQFLVVEPKMHVTEEKFKALIELAKQAGFTASSFPTKKGGRSVLFTLS